MPYGPRGSASCRAAHLRQTPCIRARERAYRQYVQRREPRTAAQVALALAEDYFHRLARSVGQGWLRRAEQHLDGLPETLAHGWLNRLKGMIALDAERKPEEAIRHVDRALDIARRLGDDLADDISRIGVKGSRVSLKF